MGQREWRGSASAERLTYRRQQEEVMVLEDHLSHEHRDAARDLWEALYNAPSREAMEAARARLTQEADVVRSAILRAAALQWRDGVMSQPQENPFK